MPNTPLKEYAHAVIFVVKANDPHLMDGYYKDKLQKIRERLQEDGNKNKYIPESLKNLHVSFLQPKLKKTPYDSREKNITFHLDHLTGLSPSQVSLL